MRPLSHCPRWPALWLATFVITSATAASTTTTLDSGLVIETTTPAPKGCHRQTENGDDIKVDYTGRLESDGTVFDSSKKPGREPLEFVLGSGQVIPGWDEGLRDMCVGESRKLSIPPELAYGPGGMGPIPGGATLIFDTELLEIVGAEDEDNSSQGQGKGKGKGKSKGKGKGKEKGDEEDEEDAEDEEDEKVDETDDEKEKPQGSEAGPKDSDDTKGECKLLGPFALIVQGILGALSLLSLVWKRYREHPRRSVKVWGFDVSKQVFGTVLLHMANLFMSMLSSGTFDVAVTSPSGKQAMYARFVQDTSQPDEQQPNPCSYYLLNLAIDTTIGIPILVGLLKIIHGLASYTALANPPESLKSGNYGHPPRWGWWFKQSILYFIGLFGMKLCVLAIFTLLPWIVWIGDWALRWTEGSNALQIVFVMFVFPLVMNAMQYYIIDSFIKDPAHGEYHPAGSEFGDDSSDDSDDEDNERTRLRPSDDSFAADHAGEGSPLVGSRGDGGARHKERLAEANPTPVPMRAYDSDGHGEGSRLSSDGGKEVR